MSRWLAALSLSLLLGLALAPAAGAGLPLDQPSNPSAAPLALARADCPPGMRWSHRLNTCVSDDASLGGAPMPMPGQGAPPPPEGCPPGLVWSPRKGARVEPRSHWWDCGPDFRWSRRWGHCVPLCPPGT